MSKLQKFWIVFLSFLPLTAGAVAPLAIGAVGAGAVIAGFSIYRSFAPVNMGDAYKFFTSCWSCDLFGSIFATLSEILPKIYHAIGIFTIPMAVILTAVWVAWTILAGFLGIKGDKKDKSENNKPYDLNDNNGAWSITGNFGKHLFKLALVIALLAFPLPRFLTTVFVEPVFNVGLAVSNTAAKITTPESKYAFEACLIATSVADDAARSPNAANAGAFSPKLRHNLTCQLGGIHQMTGLGMTVGWTMLNMGFNSQYMHKFLWKIPIFPNVPLVLAGALILVLFFFALLPVPMYFLETIIKLSMDLVMLPLMLLSWLFQGWKIMPDGAHNLKGMVDRVIQNTVGIAMVGVFVVFSVMFINAAFGGFDGA
ncbi:MAG: hypothetical protein FWG18_03855, partial [Alphaproteobacteria bacterium]|nr:hypothetical protein [Alphaproteobacteria bacterium]